jgi:hypothetical protein
MKHDPLGPAALEAVSRLLAPVVPLLLELGVGIGDVEVVLKRLYVEAARRILVAQQTEKAADPKVAQPKNQASIAAMAMMTGMTRTAVVKLLTLGTDRDTGSDIGRQRAERVISGWLHDPEFRDDRTGAPAILPLRGNPPTFTSLVKRHSGDPRVRTILTQLRRVRAIRDHPGSKVELIRNTYAPVGMDPAALEVAGGQAADYIHTLVHNLKHPSFPLYTRCVVNTRLDPEELGKIVRDCAMQAESALESVDAIINDPLATVSGHLSSEKVLRFGVGFFMFHDGAPALTITAPSPPIAAANQSRKRTRKGLSRRGK